MSPSRERPHLLWAGLVLLGLATIAAAGLLPGTYRALALLSPDSETYLNWNPGRTPAYPLLLWLMRAAAPDLSWVGWIQLAALIASAGALALGLVALYRSQLLALGVAAAILAHPQIISYAFTVLPESLFMSALMLHLGFVLRATASIRAQALVAVSVSLTALILLKPSAYALLACLPLLVLHQGRPWTPALLRLGVPPLLILTLVSAANYLSRGYFAPQAQGGYSLIAHVGPFVEPGDGRYPTLSAAIASDVAPHRHALESIDSFELYYLFSSHDYHSIEAIVRRRIVEESERRRGVTVTDHRQFPADPVLLQDLTEMGGSLARRAIFDHPAAYVRHATAQFYGLWMLPLIQPAPAVARLRAALEEVHAAAPELARSEAAFRAVPAWASLAVRVLLGGIFAATIGSLVAFLLHPVGSRWLPAAYAGLAVNATFVLVGAVQPGLPRYALVMWPAMCVAFGIVAMALARSLRT